MIQRNASVPCSARSRSWAVSPGRPKRTRLGRLSLRALGLPWLLGACALSLAGPAVAEAPASAPVKRTLCVWDPGGASGDVFTKAKDDRSAALAAGVDFVMKPYTDEKTAAEDFKAGQCHAVLMTGSRVRQFQKFSGSFEAIGGLQTYAELKSLVQAVSRPKASKLMTSGEYEVAGIAPGGAVYLLVNDRSLDTVAELAGKRIATLAYDDASKFMVQSIGSSMIAADVGTFAGMFNNGTVDACYAPATAYHVMELYKGVGEKGGVIRYPLAQLTLQLLIRKKDFPEGFGQATRAYYASQFDAHLRTVSAAEASIQSNHWLDLPKADTIRYAQQFADVRVKLRDDQALYHPMALKLMRKVRCRSDGSRAECAQRRE